MLRRGYLFIYLPKIAVRLHNFLDMHAFGIEKNDGGWGWNAITYLISNSKLICLRKKFWIIKRYMYIFIYFDKWSSTIPFVISTKVTHRITTQPFFTLVLRLFWHVPKSRKIMPKSRKIMPLMFVQCICQDAVIRDKAHII